MIGYFSLLSSAVLYDERSKLGAIPAIELKMFALDKRYRGKGVASTFLNTALAIIDSYSTDYIGAKIILLYSVPVESVLSLYKNAGFQQADGFFQHSRVHLTPVVYPCTKCFNVLSTC